MNNDLISREELKKEFARYGEKAKFTQGAVQRIIDNAPPVEQPTGEWIDEDLYAEGHSEHACYTCKYYTALTTDKEAPCRKCIDDAIHNKGCWTCWEAKQ